MTIPGSMERGGTERGSTGPGRAGTGRAPRDHGPCDVVIVADDVTGAGDTAVQFAESGWTAELRLQPGTSDAQVIAVSSDSRACTAGEAATRVRRAAAGTRGTRLFKKIDSTVRGPIRAEVDALLEELGQDAVAVVCPAFPGVGRTVVDGTVLVDDVPVSDTPVGRDPVTPVTESHLPTLLGAAQVRLDPAGGPAEWAAHLREAGRVVTTDATTDADLDRIARAVDALGEHGLPVGAAGLAGALARRWHPAVPAPAPTVDPAPAGADGTVLVVVTSLHAAARTQVQVLVDDGAAHHEPTPGQLLDDDAWHALLATLSGGPVDGTATPRPRTTVLSAPERGGTDVPPDLVARRLADAAAELVRTDSPAGLVVTGGDGARALLDGLGSSGIRLDATGTGAGSGVATGTVVGGWAEGLPIATKAGGFGESDVLITAAQAVRRRRSDR
ncbi:four-carbon acid sugar kinase family protein [Prauserella halophila]|uniref:Four-carbon acid sugar kinase family protein n=1 Tax=Prauserella halophila TaxID=185641 RepID=A0ABN1WF32_9PSEU